MKEEEYKSWFDIKDCCIFFGKMVYKPKSIESKITNQDTNQDDNVLNLLGVNSPKILMDISMETMLMRAKGSYMAFNHGELPNYGYILRSRNTDITTNQSDLIIVSTLFDLLQKTLYGCPYFMMIRPQNSHTSWNAAMITLYNYIIQQTSGGAGSDDMFNVLYPEFAQIYATIEKKMTLIMHKMVKLVQYQQTRMKKNINMSEFDEKVNILLNSVLQNISLNMSENQESILRMFVLQMNNIHMLYEIIFTIPGPELVHNKVIAK
jgi:hypothetical protein